MSDEVDVQGRRNKWYKDPQVASCLAYLRKRRVSVAGEERAKQTTVKDEVR